MKNRIGESRKMNCGFVAEIIAYRGCGDIDVRFENGAIVFNRTYTNFCRGGIKIPLQIEYIDDYAKCTNLQTNITFLIDVEDVDKIKNKSIHKMASGYAAWHVYHPTKGGQKVYLAPYIMNCPPEMDVDHIDGNKLNNRKSNLRICTRSENLYNKWKPARPIVTSEFKGVSKRGDKWQASIAFNKDRTIIGVFDTEEDAAAAYNEVAIEKHGEFARLNAI